MQNLVTLLGLVIFFLAWLSQGTAADLSKVDRAIAKEPNYAGKPEYCLIVFGNDARDRVWLVRDGETLYADKNADGDLTGPNEKVVAEKSYNYLEFHIGTVRLGKCEHQNLKVRAFKIVTDVARGNVHPLSRAALKMNKDACEMRVDGDLEVPGLKGGGPGGRLSVVAISDPKGPLLFADSPAKAPVLHFGGPLQLRGEANPTLHRGIAHDLDLFVGTPGVGPGSFTHYAYAKLIPENAFIVAEAEFPPNKPGDPPIKQHFELKERC